MVFNRKTNEYGRTDTPYIYPSNKPFITYHFNVGVLSQQAVIGHGLKERKVELKHEGM